MDYIYNFGTNRLSYAKIKIVNGRFAKPLDEELILRLAKETKGIITAEENVLAGGFGEAIVTLLAEHGLANSVLCNLTMPDSIVDHGPQSTFQNVYNLDGQGIARKSKEILESIHLNSVSK